MMSLGLVKAKREHSGRYVVVVENSTGSRKGVCNVTVVGMVKSGGKNVRYTIKNNQHSDRLSFYLFFQIVQLLLLVLWCLTRSTENLW